MRETDILKTCWESKFLGKKIRRNALALKSKKVQGKFWEMFIVALLSSAVFCLKFLLICFSQEIKGFFQSSFGNKVDFRDIRNVSPNILAKNFKKLRHGFADERALITMTVSSCHWKTLVPFCLPNKRPENAFLTQ